MIISDYTLNEDGTSGLMGDFWTVTAASEQTEYPASNLLTNDLAAKWVSWGQRASHNWVQAQCELKGQVRYLGLLGLMGLSRRPPTLSSLATRTANTYRMIVDNLYPVANRRRPQVATCSGTNLNSSTTVSILNGPIDPPNLTPTGYASTRMTAVNPAVNTVLVADFTNYNATERPLHPSATQYIRLHYGDSANIDTQSLLQLTLRYNGANYGPPIILNFAEKTAEGFIFNYAFDATNNLPGLTGRVGVSVTGASVGGSTPEPIGVEWIAELSGWTWDSYDDTTVDNSINYNQIVEMPKAVATYDPYIGETMAVEVLPDTSTCYAYIELSDFATYKVSSGVRTYTPAGGFESVAFYAGRLVIAEPTMNFSLLTPGGRNITRGGDISPARTRGGYPRSVRNPLVWEDVEIAIPKMARSDYYAIAEPFHKKVGFSKPFLVLFDTAYPAREAGWYKFTSWTAPDAGWWTGDGKSDLRFDFSCSVTEATATQIG